MKIARSVLGIMSLWLVMCASLVVNAEGLDEPIYANSLQEGYFYNAYISGDELPVLKGEEVEDSELKARLLEGMKGYEEKIDVADLGIPYSDDTCNLLQNAFREVLDENPELFYVDWIYCDSWENNTLNQIGIQYSQDIMDGVGNIDTLKVDAYEVALSEALSCVKGGMSDVEKLLALHDYLVFHCTYDYENYLNGSIPWESYTAYGALVNKTAVCNGYALAMADLIKHIGLNGYVVASQDHAWNLVYVDGNWYHIDTTWDDPVMDITDHNWNTEGMVKHAYFMVSDDELKALDTSSHGSWDATLPQATNSGAYSGYIFRDKAYETSTWYYQGNWYYLSGERVFVFGGTVATSKIDGTGYKEFPELGTCAYAQVQGDYLYVARRAYFSGVDSIKDGLYAMKLDGSNTLERIMTLLINKEYIDFRILEFAVYGDVMAVVMQHEETREWVRLEYMTDHREVEPLPKMGFARKLRWKNYKYPILYKMGWYEEYTAGWNGEYRGEWFEIALKRYKEFIREWYEELDYIQAVLIYEDGSQLPIDAHLIVTWEERENYAYDIIVCYGELVGSFQITNNSNWPIQDIFSNDTNWVYNAAKYTYDRDIMSGTDYNKFEPDKKMERCMLAQILYNMENKPSVTYHKQFDDVLDNQWYSTAVTWAYDKGIVKGYSENRFGAVDYVTREQMAQMLMKYAQMKGYNTTARADISGYKDAGKVSSWAGDAIRWAVATGVMKGKGDNLDPTGFTTRAEGAAMIKNFCEKVEK